MNEFQAIATFFTPLSVDHEALLIGIGDDAACLRLPAHQDLVVTTDTLVSGVHFLSHWDPYDIAWKAVMVNVSDIAAMGGVPCWASLALTLPSVEITWLTRFSRGLQAALKAYNLTLIGGDTTQGPLSMTLTVQGVVPQNKAVTRKGARAGDSIWVSGELGAAALAVAYLEDDTLPPLDKAVLMDKLLHPVPRVDFAPLLQTYASAAIDISDGLSADLNHVCEASGVGAVLDLDAIPVHPLVKHVQHEKAIPFALSGGDDYELCFTVPASKEQAFQKALQTAKLAAYKIGIIEQELGLRGADGQRLMPQGYQHF